MTGRRASGPHPESGRDARGRETTPVIIVHSLAHAVAALSAAAEAGRPILLLSAPDAGIYAGSGWFREVIRAAGDAVPTARFSALLDCGGDAGAVMAAIRAGLEAILFTGRDDVALLGFTSGTTGEPKATMHFHRDLLTIADAYAMEVLRVTPDDVFVGSPPLAFTFGLGGLAIFPLRFGAAATLLENASPANMVEIIQTYRATISFTAPTAYRAMLQAMDAGADLSSLRIAVSAGETLPAPVFEEWMRKTGKPILDGIGTTEMLHIFISNRVDDTAAGRTGKPVTGYHARVVDDDMNELSRGAVGHLAVRGPTGCRYLADRRQKTYVRNGWNLTGDSFVEDEAGYFVFVARSDDMIISAGYNIAGPEVEAALLACAEVAECAVVGAVDAERGQIVQAHVVLAAGVSPDDTTRQRLQDHVKATIAPYKYQRSVMFLDALPKTQTGKGPAVPTEIVAFRC